MAYMTAEEAAEWGKTLSFEKVWAALMEDRANIDRLFQKAEEDRKRAEEDRKRADEDRRKSEEAFNRRMAKLDREIEKTTKNINGLSDSVGQFMENMVASNLWTKFDELGYAFTSSHEWQFMLENVYWPRQIYSLKATPMRWR